MNNFLKLFGCCLLLAAVPCVARDNGDRVVLFPRLSVGQTFRYQIGYSSKTNMTTESTVAVPMAPTGVKMTRLFFCWLRWKTYGSMLAEQWRGCEREFSIRMPPRRMQRLLTLQNPASPKKRLNLFFTPMVKSPILRDWIGFLLTSKPSGRNGYRDLAAALRIPRGA